MTVVLISEHNYPSVSVVIPTLNSTRTMRKCLESVRSQKYPKDKVEIIIIDGGSSDDTLKIAADFNVDKILRNPLRTGEAGKAIGVENAKNEIIAFIDSDNILPSHDWLSKMTEPFNDEETVGSEPLYYTYRREDPLITRYCSLVGMNDILCLFLGNYDRYSYVTGRWTSLKVNSLDRGDYIIAELDEKNIPTIGANGFLVRREVLKNLEYYPYLFDVDIIYQLIQIGYNRFAKVKIGIVHLFADSTRGYIKKTKRRISDYNYYQKHGLRKYPWKTTNQRGIQKFILYTLLVPLLIGQSSKGNRKSPDIAWLYHVIACWITLLTYGSLYLIMASSNVIAQDRSGNNV